MDTTETTSSPATSTSNGTPSPAPMSERRRIEEQLEQLKKKEAELRRALAITDHPQLGDAFRVIEGRSFGVTRALSKMAEGLSKAEERKKETLEKKLEGARAKRAEIDGQIAELEKELAPLGEERTRAFEAEKSAAFEQLVLALAEHEPAFRAAELDPFVLVPELHAWKSELEATAASMSAPANESPANES